MGHKSGRGYSSSNSERDPYTVLSNWTSGKIAFWRDNPMYSQESKDYFEDSLQRWHKREKVITRIK